MEKRGNKHMKQGFKEFWLNRYIILFGVMVLATIIIGG